MPRKLIKPRLRVLGGYWLCSLPGSGFTGVGLSPLSAYELWSMQTRAIKLVLSSTYGKFAQTA